MECTSCGFSLPSLEQHPLNQHHPQSTHTHLSHHTRVYENIPIECLTLFPPINYHSLTPALPPLQSTRHNIQFYSTSSQVASLFSWQLLKWHDTWNWTKSLLLLLFVCSRVRTQSLTSHLLLYCNMCFYSLDTSKWREFAYFNTHSQVRPHSTHQSSDLYPPKVLTCRGYI